jgi:thiamine biosynthesis protein ThiS
MADAISIEVNGEKRDAPLGTNVVRLLQLLGLQAGRVAIEYNLQILPRARWEQTQVSDGDRLEIVQFVGGG